MPIYEYTCAACDRVFEVLRLGSVAETATCPACGSTAVSRQPSRFALSGAQPSGSLTPGAGAPSAASG
ncbi:MAG: zinc ribbon domain-containing protein [Deltaproteobacteria bacterium]|nr:zinc ribbon domain-containing protein [Deltaproteobacteria bacterium]MBI3078349.1 zinc ribbon domain-containing protein [Deltaproteobacteria bacterium]